MASINSYTSSIAWRRSVRCDCSRSHGQPVGERSFAMTLIRSAMAEFFFIGENIEHPTSNAEHRTNEATRPPPQTSMFDVGCSAFDVALKNYEVIPMHQFHAREFFGADFLGVELGDAACEFRSVQVADPHDIVGDKISFATRHAGRQQTFS